MKKTIILMWNPAISSYKMDAFEDDLDFLTDDWETDYNWSIHEHDKVEEGDRFYMVRCGQGNTGIVMSGTLVGEPYCDEDWAGRGRKIYYMDMEPDYMVHSDKIAHITTEQLLRELPGFDWTGGHAGRVLPAPLAEKLEVMWNAYTKKLHEEGCIDNVRAGYKNWGNHYRRMIERLEEEIEDTKQIIKRRGY